MKRRFFGWGGLAVVVVVAAGLMMTASVQAQNYAGGTSSVSTPHTPDGKPDLSGMWIDPHPYNIGLDNNSAAIQRFRIRREENGDSSQVFPSRRCDPTQKGTAGTGCFEETNETIDTEFTFRSDPNRPLYKPEYWDKVQDLDYNTNTKDPQFRCVPQGVPRMGPPAQIIQTPKYVLFFYNQGSSATTNQFRIIPTDGRGHDPVRAKDISYFGDAVGHWDGDTLVVESVGFNDETWLARVGGYLHSYDMKVTERFRREGNILHYQATVEDPTVLLQPWVMNPKDLDSNTDPKAYIQEGDQCGQFDPGLFTGKIRH
jgi:hypothetical protein